MTLSRRVVAEGLGTALLLAAVVGSGIIGQQLAGGNIALALLAKGVTLVTLIFTFGPDLGRALQPGRHADGCFE